MKSIFIITKIVALGGAERMSVLIANELAGKYKIHLAIRGNGRYRELGLKLHESINVLPLFEKNYPDWSKLKNLLKLDFRYFLNLIKYVKSNNIDLLYAHDASVSQAALIKLLTRKPLVWHNHNGEMLKFTPEKIKKYKKFLFNTDAVISVSHELTQFCTEQFNKPGRIFRTIPNFILPDTSGKQTTLPVGFNVLCVGNIRKVKNQLLLLRAFIEFKKSVKDANLVLAGKELEENYWFEIRKEIELNNLSNSVCLLGSRADIYNICQQAHIGVLASEHEGFAVVLLEYGFAGLPIVSSDILVCKRILNGGLYGNLFTNGDVKDLAGKMMNVYNDYQAAKGKANKFKEHVIKEYGPENSIETIAHVFEEVTKHG